MGKLNLKGKQFGRLTVISAGDRINGRSTWLCVCACGNTKLIKTHELRSGDTRSCGCLVHENKSLMTHGDSRSPEYKSWTAMKDRCYGVNHSSYKNYHDRGITVCDRWLHSYENFLADMGRKPSKNMSLDRIDNNGNYTPENCRWATIKQQNNNSRNNRFIDYKGETKTLKQWSEIYNLSAKVVKDRLDVLGWSFEKAILTPKRIVKIKSNGRTENSLQNRI